MKGKEFLEKMGLIDPDYIEAAEISTSKKKVPWLKWGTAVTCFAVAIFATTLYLRQDKPNEPQEPPVNLPILSIGEYKTGGMGFEGYMAYDISDLVNANPWNEELGISTLPVYQNVLCYDFDLMVAPGADVNKMQELLVEVATRLGIDPNSLTITQNELSEGRKQHITSYFQAKGQEVPAGYLNAEYVVGQAPGIRIEVDQSMTATIHFEPGIPLPEQYNFGENASYEDNVAVAEYLKSEYSELIGMNNPQANIYDGDYTFDAQQIFLLEFFDAPEDKTEQIVNYNFNRVGFYGNTDGTLFLARVFRPDLSKKIGDYPIISAEQAKELLLNGHYMTTVPYEISEEELIKKVELVYQDNRYQEYYIPFYRFYVELPEKQLENGLKSYGAYYVPAIESSYISDMPIREPTFNR